MNKGLLSIASVALLLTTLSTSCALHPRGELEERRRAEAAYPVAEPAALAADASPGEMLDYAYAANDGLRELYWNWVAAIEAVPQEASPAAGLALSIESMFMDGKTSLERTTLGLASDPMAGITWPGKLAAAGARSLETARAAGYRFQDAKNRLRVAVLGAYYDYALLAESIRLKQISVMLLTTETETAAAGVKAGMASTGHLLQVQNQRDLAASDLETLESRVPGQVASLNALLGRDTGAPLALPAELPPPRELPYSDAEILTMLAERNPELAALAHQSEAAENALTLARRQYFPDLGLKLSGDLEGITRSLMATITAPIVRHEAIEASIRQAQAQLEASRAARRQAEQDLKAEAVLTLYDLRDTQRQIALFEGAVVPRLEQSVEVTRAEYVAGRTGLSQVLEARRMVVEADLMLAAMRVEREKLLLDLERLAAPESN
jgi:cobalt-zinc-cadmium efflux system outer membrane protein